MFGALSGSFTDYLHTNLYLHILVCKMVRYVCCVYTGLPRFSDENLAMSRTLCVLTKFCFAKLEAQVKSMYGNKRLITCARGTS